jgi:hypothetical protein
MSKHREKRKFNLVTIEWVDAASYTEEWHFDKELDSDIEPTLVHSSGYLIRENDLFYVLAGTVTYSNQRDDYMYCCVIEVPKGCIKKVEKADGIEV